MRDGLETLDAPALDRHIADPVHPPEFWLEWLRGAEPVRARAPNALLAHASRLVVVAPHPDDEVLMCAGLIQAALARGVGLAVVAVTDGEACFGADADLAGVAAVRRAEARAGLLALGAGRAHVHRWGIPDGQVPAHEADMRRELESILEPGDQVVAPWHLDGHPDHDAAGRAAAQACQAVGAPLLEAPVWMWHWASPGHPAVRWQRLCISPLSACAVARKARALACHASQLAPRGAQPAVVDDALQRRSQWPFESFFLP